MHKLLTLAVLVTAIASSYAFPAEAQNWRTMTSARQLRDDESVHAVIHYGAGNLQVGMADSPYLYQMEIRYDGDGPEPVVEYDADDHVLTLGSGSGDFNRRSMREGREANAKIRLSKEVPLDLDLKFGAGKADIELGGLSLENVSIGTGASETIVSFSTPNLINAEEVSIEAGAADLRVIGLGNSRAERVEFKGGVGSTVLDFSGGGGNMEAELTMGVGSLTLRLPRSHGIRLERNSSFLTSFSAAGLRQDGDSYVSSNWSSANQRIDIELSAALGSIDIEWVE